MCNFIKILNFIFAIAIIYNISSVYLSLGHESKIKYTYDDDKEWNSDTRDAICGSDSRTTGVVYCNDRWISAVVPENGKISFKWRKACSDDCHQFNFYINGSPKPRCNTLNWSEPNNYSVKTNDKLEWKFKYIRSLKNLCPSYCKGQGWLCIEFYPEQSALWVDLISPENNTEVYRDVQFNYSVQNDQLVNNCTLFVDDNKTDLTHNFPKTGDELTENYQFKRFGAHKWCIACCDSKGCIRSKERSVLIKNSTCRMSWFTAMSSVHADGAFARLEINCSEDTIKSAEIYINLSRALRGEIQNCEKVQDEKNDSFTCHINATRSKIESLNIFINPEIIDGQVYNISIRKCLIKDIYGNIFDSPLCPPISYVCGNDNCKRI
jgi:hypothetical protein